MTPTPKPLLIETWIPFDAIGAESRRERGASSALPPLYFLHVWWARRPLVASRAAVLASCLPAWSSEWPKPLLDRFPDEAAYHAWFTRLLGILGDPVEAREAIRDANIAGVRLSGSPYGYDRAFTRNPDPDQLGTLGELLEFAWGTREVSVLDPFAGGGSIPFEAMRFGFRAIANELNPVAAVILKATLDYPARFGPELADDIRKWGDIWAKRVEEQLKPFFPKSKGENIFAYLWARTVACPETGKPVPLSPNWWLRTGENPAAVQLIAEPRMKQPRFEILHGKAAERSKPDEGTVRRGDGRSPWTGQVIPGDYIKTEAQGGRMGEMLYCVAVKKPGGVEFRTPTEQELQEIALATAERDHVRPRWESEGNVPSDVVPAGLKTAEPLRYGMVSWADMFSPRQMLANGTICEVLKAIQTEIQQAEATDRGEALSVFLALTLDKAIVFNTYQARYAANRTKMNSAFDRHDFAFKWSFGEFDAAANLLPWALDQITDAYKGIAALAFQPQMVMHSQPAIENGTALTVSIEDAASLREIANGSICNLTIDPPYYDNVMYAELSDFFYVWLKRTVGHLFPDWFRSQLTDKDAEAVANPARFQEFGGKKRDLAKQDYERKMAACFREMHRVLRDDGSLTVMFTHKRIEAWDTLATALLDGGFHIRASWPVHTEFEHSLHQARKNAAASTIFLACRKRPDHADGREPAWWDDLKDRVRRVAREKAREFAAQGVRGVDLYISVFGPTLSVLSERWPVLTSEVDPKTGDPKVLRPETALDLAREEVMGLRREILLQGRDVSFDPITDWYLMAWDSFAAVEFPYDEARKLAIGVGVELDKEVMASEKLARKKGQFVRLLEPWERRAKGRVDDEAESFPVWINAAHTAMMVYREDGPQACEVFLRRSGLRKDSTFKALLQAMINAVPRRKLKGKFLRPEAEVLESLRLAFFEDLMAPEEDEPEPEMEQLAFEADFEDQDEDDE